MTNGLDFVHRFVPAEGNVARTLLLLHGTGGDENDLLPLGRTLDAKANLLSPRGKVLENDMPRFFRRLAEGVFDQEDLVNRTRELTKFVEAAVNRYRLDPRCLFAVGFSNGANIAASLLLLYPRFLAGAVLLRAMMPFEPEVMPDLSGRPVYLAAGRSDPNDSSQEHGASGGASTKRWRTDHAGLATRRSRHRSRRDRSRP